MFERQFYHLTDLAYLLLQPSDILVGYSAHAQLNIGHVPFFDMHLRSLSNSDYSRRGGRENCERKHFSGECDPPYCKEIPFGQASGQQASFHIRVYVLSQADGCAGHGQRQNDPVRLNDIRLSHSNIIFDRDASVPSDKTIHSYDALSLVLLTRPVYLRGCGSLSDYLKNIADIHAELHPCAGIYTHPALADILLHRFSYLQLHFALFHMNQSVMT